MSIASFHGIMSPGPPEEEVTEAPKFKVPLTPVKVMDGEEAKLFCFVSSYSHFSSQIKLFPQYFNNINLQQLVIFYRIKYL